MDSTAVGLAPEILSYRGNDGTINPDVRLQHAPRPCPHSPPEQVGDPVFK
jgi:hypothetical protein